LSQLPSSEPRTTRISELNGSDGGRGKGIRGPRSFVPVGDTNRDKRGSFIPIGGSNRDKKPFPPPARLAVGPRTKATYYPGPNGCRDKWSGIKTCFIVVEQATCEDRRAEKTNYSLLAS